MKQHLQTAAAFVAATLALGAAVARADGDQRFSLGAAYKEECGSCHVAYPPQLLPPRGWQAVMAGLDRHFGTDASLDPAKAGEIGTYLAANAGRPERLGAPTDGKISETAWFRRKHRDGHDGLSAAIWKSPAVKTPGNCGACHRGAADGNYGEDDIRLPRTK